ncbi:alginate lyase [Enterobacteriaceae bacterium RIT691]|nr:alginate lyase [Enterobacteriaceae bacterium RIT691]
MKQFTAQQIENARQKVTPEIILRLIEGNREVINNDTLVPQTGCATWNHYFYCPEHSVRLLWDRHSPNKHRCPIDGAVFTGEPYYGAWWRWLNGLNAKACYELGLLWLLTDDARYLNKVIDILMQYARYYPDYEEHGGIPYNGPGKANAQTLCEANCHADFARGFDIVSAVLTAEQHEYISQRLLRCGADFLMQHRSDQIHNHEVKINSTIGIIGILLDDQRYLNFAVNSRYRLRYQLEHARLPGGLWFEGSLHYHYYALQGFMAFEKFAQHSAWSLLDEPFYPEMLSLPLTLLMPDMTLPKVNDCVNGQEKLSHVDLYEFAYSYYGKHAYGQLLTHLYSAAPRDNIDALFYGLPLPERALSAPEGNEHNPEAGFTLIRPTPGRTVCIKHGPYGGEHDHYDRLNLIVFNNYSALFPDLGTTGYGAPLHYGYYKNTFSHNTLCVNGLNQPPARPRVIAYQSQEKETRLITEVDWCSNATLPDSKTRVEWDDESYRDIVFRRTIVVTENLLIDKWDVENPHYQCVDAVYHITASAIQATPPTDVRICYPYVIQATEQPLKGKIEVRYQADIPVSVTCFSTNNSALIKAKGPSNPSTSMIEYLLLRSHDKQFSAVFVTDFTGNGKIDIVKTEEAITVIDMTSNQQYRL